MTMMVMVLGECLWSFSSARAKGDGSGFGRRVILFCPRVMWPTCKLFLIYNVAQCACIPHICHMHHMRCRCQIFQPGVKNVCIFGVGNSALACFSMGFFT